MDVAAGTIIETTANQIYRVVSFFNGTHLDCVPVKRSKGVWVEKAKARPALIQPQYVLRIVA